MIELYIVRHGQTETNRQNRVNGFATNLNLNEVGRQQAKDLRDNLDINMFDEVISSPLNRAHKTAEILNQNVHNIEIDDRLAEINYGSWDGQTVEDTISAHPDGYDENRLISANYIKYAKNGESFNEVFKRAESFLKDMSTKNDEKILVVCHAFIARSIVKTAIHIPDIADILEPANASVIKIQISKTGRPYLVYYSRLDNI